MSAVFMSIKGFTNERLGLLIVSLGLTIVTLVKMIRLNNKETKSRIDAVVNDRHDFIVQWTIPEALWQDYLKKKLKFDISESTSYGYISGGIVAFILAFSTASNYELMTVIGIAIGAFTAIFVIVKMGVILVAKKKYKNHSKSSSAEVHFAKNLVIINGRLVMLDDFGYRLKSFRVEEKFDMNLLAFLVETGAGNRKNGHQYFIPIPEGHMDEADRLVTLYSAIMS